MDDYLQFVNLEAKTPDVKKKALRGSVTNAKSSRHAMQSRASPGNTNVCARLRRVHPEFVITNDTSCRNARSLA